MNLDFMRARIRVSHADGATNLTASRVSDGAVLDSVDVVSDAMAIECERGAMAGRLAASGYVVTR